MSDEKKEAKKCQFSLDDYFDCNGPCFCGFKIPINAAYVWTNIWLILNGFSFPVMSYVFWPEAQLCLIAWLICFANAVFGIMTLINMRSRKRVIFKVAFYGTLALYVSGSLVTIISVNTDIEDNARLVMKTFETYFNVELRKSRTFGILHSTQIVYYAYLFVFFIYWGLILQLFDIVHSKKYLI